MKAVLSVFELSKLLGVSTDTIYAMVRERQVPHIRIRRRILFHADTVVEWLRKNVTN